MEKRLFTSESVTEGHPDKVCDAISDAILDACLAQDPMSRVACETACCTGFALVTGEITTNAQLDIPAIVRETILEIGYDEGKKGIDGNSCAVMVALDSSAPARSRDARPARSTCSRRSAPPRPAPRPRRAARPRRRPWTG